MLVSRISIYIYVCLFSWRMCLLICGMRVALMCIWFACFRIYMHMCVCNFFARLFVGVFVSGGEDVDVALCVVLCVCCCCGCLFCCV